MSGCLRLCDQACGIVAGTLGLTSATRSCTDVIIRKPDVHRLDATGEVRTGWRGDEQILVGIAGTNTKADLGGEHKWAKVERFLRTLGHPILILTYQRLDTSNEELVRNLRHRQPSGGALEASRVHMRAEGDDRAIRMAVGLQALKDGLAVVDEVGGGVKGQRAVGHQFCVMPTVSLGPLCPHHVVGEVTSESGIGQNLLPPLYGGWIDRGIQCDWPQARAHVICCR